MYSYQLFVRRIIFYGVLFIILLLITLITVDPIRKPKPINKRYNKTLYLAAGIGMIVLIVISIGFKQAITLVIT